jgi:hypothetical protein
VKRTALLAKSDVKPMAVKTGDGSMLPDEHAEPDDAQIPARSNIMRREAPFWPGKEKLALFGRRRQAD